MINKIKEKPFANKRQRLEIESQPNYRAKGINIIDKSDSPTAFIVVDCQDPVPDCSLK